MSRHVLNAITLMTDDCSAFFIVDVSNTQRTLVVAFIQNNAISDVQVKSSRPLSLSVEALPSTLALLDADTIDSKPGL